MEGFARPRGGEGRGPSSRIGLATFVRCAEAVAVSEEGLDLLKTERLKLASTLPADHPAQVGTKSLRLIGPS